MSTGAKALKTASAMLIAKDSLSFRFTKRALRNIAPTYFLPPIKVTARAKPAGKNRMGSVPNNLNVAIAIRP